MECRVLFHPEGFSGGQGGTPPLGPRPGVPGPQAGAGVKPVGATGPEPVVLEEEEEVMPVAVTPPPRVGPAAVRPAAQAPAVARPGVGGAAGQSGAGMTPPQSGAAPDESTPKIRAMDQRLAGAGRHEDNWKRSPNQTGSGAIHCRSFHCKLTGDSLENLDRQINEWLDAHPQYEVKFVTATVGEWLGKLREPNLILQVWV